MHYSSLALSRSSVQACLESVLVKNNTKGIYFGFGVAIGVDVEFVYAHQLSPIPTPPSLAFLLLVKSHSRPNHPMPRPSMTEVVKIHGQPMTNVIVEWGPPLDVMKVGTLLTRAVIAGD